MSNKDDYRIPEDQKPPPDSSEMFVADWGTEPGKSIAEELESLNLKFRNLKKATDRVIADNAKQIFFGSTADEEAKAFNCGLRHMQQIVLTLLRK